MGTCFFSLASLNTVIKNDAKSKSQGNCLSQLLKQNSVNFTIEDRNELKDINLTLKELVSEINSLRKALDDSKTEINKVKVENSRLKQIVNINLYKIDDLD